MKQRQLTQEELNLAHSLGWNPTDFIATDSSIIFENKRNYQVLYPDGKLGALMNRPSNAFNAQPIPRKAFDISEYQFSDNDIHGAKVISEANEIEIELKLEVDFISLNKSELIAMTKALGVTAEDFK